MIVLGDILLPVFFKPCWNDLLAGEIFLECLRFHCMLYLLQYFNEPRLMGLKPLDLE